MVAHAKPIGSGRYLVQGRTAPNAAVEALNVSEALRGRVRLNDTRLVGTSDDKGRFSCHIDAVGGDLLRLRCRTRDRKAGPWLMLRVLQSGKLRLPAVALFRIGLAPAGARTARVFGIDPSRPIAEPGRSLVFVNLRNGKRRQITLGEKEGTLSRGRHVPASAGDRLSVGVHTRSGRINHLGTLTVPSVGKDDGPLMMPAPARDGRSGDGTPWFAWRRLKTPLFAGRLPRPTDVCQGEIADCHLSSAAAALAAARPEMVKQAIREKDDDTYTVTFHRYDSARSTYEPVHITVDARFYVRPSGKLLYGSSSHQPSSDGTSLWWPLLEKAYAVWKGSYEAIGNGGMPSALFEAVMGCRPHLFFVDDSHIDRVWDLTQQYDTERRPMVAITLPSRHALMYRNTRFFPDHTYTIIGCRRRGRRLLLRNPWGETTPASCRAWDNGLFEIAIERFVDMFHVVHTVHSNGRTRA